MRRGADFVAEGEGEGDCGEAEEGGDDAHGDIACAGEALEQGCEVEVEGAAGGGCAFGGRDEVVDGEGFVDSAEFKGNASSPQSAESPPRTK